MGKRTIRIFTFRNSDIKNISDSKRKKCSRCSKKFYLGELIVSKPSGKTSTKRYHKKCAEVYNII
jgi:hypothetical protein